MYSTFHGHQMGGLERGPSIGRLCQVVDLLGLVGRERKRGWIHIYADCRLCIFLCGREVFSCQISLQRIIVASSMFDIVGFHGVGSPSFPKLAERMPAVP